MSSAWPAPRPCACRPPPGGSDPAPALPPEFAESQPSDLMLTVLFIPRPRSTIRNMSVLELLFALLLVCLMAGMGLVAFLVWSLVRRSEAQAADVAELKSRLQSGGHSQEIQAAEVRERLSQT